MDEFIWRKRNAIGEIGPFAVCVSAPCLLCFLAAIGPGADREPGYEQVKDSVVVVKAYDQTGKTVGQGSGVMLPSGDIITNYHVVKVGVGTWWAGASKPPLPP